MLAFIVVLCLAVVCAAEDYDDFCRTMTKEDSSESRFVPGTCVLMCTKKVAGSRLVIFELGKTLEAGTPCKTRLIADGVCNKYSICAKAKAESGPQGIRDRTLIPPFVDPEFEGGILGRTIFPPFEGGDDGRKQ